MFHASSKSRRASWLACAAVAIGAFAVASALTRPTATARASALRFAPNEASTTRATAPFAPPTILSWSVVRSDATRLLGRRIRIVVQFRQRVEHWASYLSRFGDEDFAAFQFWADEQLPWRIEDFDAPIVRLFVRDGSPAEEQLAHARTYARFEIEGTLRELFLSEPWIEVEAIRELPEHLSEGTVIHAGRALSLIDGGVWKLASLELEQALQGSLPDRSRRELEVLADLCRRNGGARAPSPDENADKAARPWNGRPSNPPAPPKQPAND